MNCACPFRRIVPPLTGGILIAACLWLIIVTAIPADESVLVLQRYGRHLVQHHEFSFNQGERFDGFVDPLWLAVAALPRLFAAPSLPVVRIAALLCALGIFLTTARLTGPVAAIPAFVIILCTPPILDTIHTANDMPMITFLLLIALMVRGHELRRGRINATLNSGLLFAVAGVAHPWAIMAGAGLTAGSAWSALKKRLPRLDFFLLFRSWLVPIAAYWCWKLVYFGHVLPPHLAPITFRELPGRMAAVVFTTWRVAGPLFIAAVLGGIVAGRRNRLTVTAAVMAGLMLFNLALLPGNGTAAYTAFTIPFVFAALTAVTGFMFLLKQSPRRWTPLLGIIGMSFLVFHGWRGARMPGTALVRVSPRNAIALITPEAYAAAFHNWLDSAVHDPRIATGAWLESWLPAKTTIAVAGALGAAVDCHHSVLDLGGEHSPQTASLRSATDSGRQAARFLCNDTEADFLVIAGGMDAAGEFVSNELGRALHEDSLVNSFYSPLN
ncbi:hypothetical protein JW905_00605, partial [bacterium]|nr:hypothetical protein [candidate division CSSED10-310 bacterium]